MASGKKWMDNIAKLNADKRERLADAIAELEKWDMFDREFA